MLVTEFLDKLPPWGIFLVSSLIILLSIELGFHMGLRRGGMLVGDKKVRTGPVVTASLSLAAFVLAMTFGAVESRFNELKHIALDEANAIGTAFLRADLLPKADRTEARRLLSEYVDLRLEAEQVTAGEFERTTRRSEMLHGKLWSIAIANADRQATPISALFVQSLNEMIDIFSKRITIGISYRLPWVIWSVLYGLVILAAALGGYDRGLSGSRRVWAVTVSTAVAFSIVLALVVTMDRPHQHLSTATQAAMMSVQEDVRQSMQARP